MKIQAWQGFGAAVGDEIRAEMAAQKKTNAEYAAFAGISPHTAGNRLMGKTELSALDIALSAQWLGLTPDVLVSRAMRRLRGTSDTVVDTERSPQFEKAAA